MVYLLTSIISNLLSTCDLLDTLNEKGRLSENEEKCKAHMNASKSCADIIRSITMHINLIFGRAKFILELMTKVAPPANILLQLVKTIKTLGSSKFFRFVMESLTKALIVIVETASRNMFAKALSKDGCLETSFRSCLGAIRQAIALVHACGTDEMPKVQRAQSNTEWQAAADVYLSFVVSIEFGSLLLKLATIECFSNISFYVNSTFNRQRNFCHRLETAMKMVNIGSYVIASQEESLVSLLLFARYYH